MTFILLNDKHHLLAEVSVRLAVLATVADSRWKNTQNTSKPGRGVTSQLQSENRQAISTAPGKPSPAADKVLAFTRVTAREERKIFCLNL